MTTPDPITPASLADRIRSEAAIADRPGQMKRLEQIAAEVEQTRALVLEILAWDRPYDTRITAVRAALSGVSGPSDLPERQNPIPDPTARGGMIDRSSQNTEGI